MWSEIVPGGGHWSWRMPRGSAIRFVALEDGPNVSAVLYSALEKLERYNMPDSLKAQHTAHYQAGHVLMSDMGRSLASVTADSLGWHDPLGALLDNERLALKYGERRYEDARNGMYRSGKDGLLIEIGNTITNATCRAGQPVQQGEWMRRAVSALRQTTQRRAILWNCALTWT
jgi:hypothetical protein